MPSWKVGCFFGNLPAPILYVFECEAVADSRLEGARQRCFRNDKKDRCPTGPGMTRRVWPQVEGRWLSKALPSARTEGWDAKQPPEIGLLTTTVRKPEDRCPAFAGHDERDALLSLGMTEKDSTDGAVE